MVLETVAVTGASGMLGRHVVAALKAHGFRTVTCTRSGQGDASARSWDLTQWKIDTEFDALFDAVDAIAHAGAAVPAAAKRLDDAELFDANVRATANLADWARRRGKPIVYVSGAIVYADPGEPDIREGAPLGWSGLGGRYGMTKLLAEDILRREEQAGLRLAVLRPSSIYGHGLSAEKMVTSLALKAQRGDVIELTEPVADTTNLIHAADVAHAVVSVLRRDAWSTFNLAAESNTSVLQLAEACVSVTGRGRIEIRKSGDPARAPASRFRLNCDSARARLDWSPRVSLADGIRTILDNNAIVVS